MLKDKIDDKEDITNYLTITGNGIKTYANSQLAIVDCNGNIIMQGESVENHLFNKMIEELVKQIKIEKPIS